MRDRRRYTKVAWKTQAVHGLEDVTELRPCFSKLTGMENLTVHCSHAFLSARRVVASSVVQIQL